MRKDPHFNQIPDFYGHVPALGAALLVDATSNLFRSSNRESKQRRERLLTLEHLVSKYTVFDATESRDTIYALLAIAKDTTPRPIQPKLPDNFKQLPVGAQQSLNQALMNRSFSAEIYPVDYTTPAIEVYRYFV